MNLYTKTQNRVQKGLPRVVLRADAGSRIGMGHFVRTCALASYLRDEFHCVITSRNPDIGTFTPHQLSMIAEAGAIPASLNGREMAEFDKDFLNFLQPDDIVVLDNYYYTSEYQTFVRNVCSALICIDDVHDRHFTADAVLTFCPLVRTDFSLEDYTLFRGGMEWAFLRKPFLSPLSKRDEKRKDEPLNIAMAMGGADPYRLTDKMVAAVRNAVPDARIDVIAGSSVKTECGSLPGVRLWREADASTIAKIFDRVDAGIFPASTVCVEALARRLPIIAGHYVDNQKEIYADGVKRGWFAPLGNLLDSEEELTRRLGEAIQNLPIPPEIDFRNQCEKIREIFRNFRDRR